MPPGVASIEGTLTFEFTPPGQTRTYLAAAEPLRLEVHAAPFGALVVAKPKTDLRRQWLPLLQRLALAFLVGAAIAGALGWYLSRRITGPVRELSDATDEIAAGRYDVRVKGRGGGEIGHLAERFNEMAVRLAESEERERHFLMSVSHELRTPLTAIKGHVDALRDGLVDDPELSRPHSTSSRRRERGWSASSETCSTSRSSARTASPCSPKRSTWAGWSSRPIRRFAEEARRREIDYQLVENGEAPTIMTDGDRVLQVITNLLSNALHWTPDGGRVEVGIADRERDVSVDVADSGPGITREQQDRIFRPFVSGDTQGTGLGLPIARELARALGGRVEVDSDVGRGSRFRLVLPARLSEQPANH